MLDIVLKLSDKGKQMSKKQPDFTKCKSCINFDKDKSNDNWTVCTDMQKPVSILLEGSKNCPSYKVKNHE